jgi:hypothetical protein
LRYLKTGSGRAALILLHTVRTQLDYFQFVIPNLVDAFTVYAIDLPGMGWSDIDPGASYTEPALRRAVVDFVKALNLTDVILAGESMEGDGVADGLNRARRPHPKGVRPSTTMTTRKGSAERMAWRACSSQRRGFPQSAPLSRERRTSRYWGSCCAAAWSIEASSPIVTSPSCVGLAAAPGTRRWRVRSTATSTA